MFPVVIDGGTFSWNLKICAKTRGLSMSKSMPLYCVFPDLPEQRTTLVALHRKRIIIHFFANLSHAFLERYVNMISGTGITVQEKTQFHAKRVIFLKKY